MSFGGGLTLGPSKSSTPSGMWTEMIKSGLNSSKCLIRHLFRSRSRLQALDSGAHRTWCSFSVIKCLIGPILGWKVPIQIYTFCVGACLELPAIRINHRNDSPVLRGSIFSSRSIHARATAPLKFSSPWIKALAKIFFGFLSVPGDQNDKLACLRRSHNLQVASPYHKRP